MYVLDEPSIGLHQRDNQRLIATLRRLRVALLVGRLSGQRLAHEVRREQRHDAVEEAAVAVERGEVRGRRAATRGIE